MRGSTSTSLYIRAAAGHAVAALKVLANEDRLLLLCQLSLGEMCVSDLEQQLNIVNDIAAHWQTYRDHTPGAGP
jgi:hypothetical protein